jgi:hypothetical protein
VLALPSKAAVDGWLIHRGPPIFRNQPGIIRGFLTSTVLLVFGYALDPWHTLSGCGVSASRKWITDADFSKPTSSLSSQQFQKFWNIFHFQLLK